MEKFKKLRAIILERSMTHSQVAKAMGINSSTFSAKINGQTEWTRAEMLMIRSILDLTPNEFYAIFFAA